MAQTMKFKTLTEETKQAIFARIERYKEKFPRPTFRNGKSKTVKNRNYYGAAYYDEETNLLELSWIRWPKGPRRPASNPKKWEYDGDVSNRFWIDPNTKTVWYFDRYAGNTYYTHVVNHNDKYKQYTGLWKGSGTLVTKMLSYDEYHSALRLMFDHTILSLNTKSCLWNGWYKTDQLYHYDTWLLREWLCHETTPACYEGSKRYNQVMKEMENVKSVDTRNFVSNGYRTVWYYDNEKDIFRLYDHNANGWNEIYRVAFRENTAWAYENTFKSEKPWTYVRSCAWNISGSDIPTPILNLESHKFYDGMVKSTPNYQTEGFSFVRLYKMYANVEVEQICKMGLVHLADGVTSYSVYRVLGGAPKPYATNLSEKYGLSNRQLRLLDENFETINGGAKCNGELLSRMREINRYQPLSTLGDNIILALKGASALLGGYYGYYGSNSIKERYLNRIPKEELLKLLLKIGSWKSTDDRHIVVDTFSMAIVSRTDPTGDYLWIRTAETVEDCVLQPSDFKFKNMRELVQLHDRLVTLREERRRIFEANRAQRQAQENEEYRKKLERNNKARATMEFADSDFMIRLPKTIDEITREGSELHHCVGGYAYRHANGETTILFLRRTSDPDKSFYTIEVNDGNVVQIHGFANKWLGNDPDAAKFVYKWLKEKGFTFRLGQLLDTAKGYCSSGNWLPESILED